MADDAAAPAEPAADQISGVLLLRGKIDKCEKEIEQAAKDREWAKAQDLEKGLKVLKGSLRKAEAAAATAAAATATAAAAAAAASAAANGAASSSPSVLPFSSFVRCGQVRAVSASQPQGEQIAMLWLGLPDILERLNSLWKSLTKTQFQCDEMRKVPHLRRHRSPPPV